MGLAASSTFHCNFDLSILQSRREVREDLVGPWGEVRLEILIGSAGGPELWEFLDLGPDGNWEADLGEIGLLYPPVCKPCGDMGREMSMAVDLRPADRRLPPLFTLRVSEAMAMASSIDVTVAREVRAYELTWPGEGGVVGDGMFIIILSCSSGRGAFRIFSPSSRAEFLVCAFKPATSLSFRAFSSASTFSRTSDSDICSGDDDLTGYVECIIDV